MLVGVDARHGTRIYAAKPSIAKVATSDLNFCLIRGNKKLPLVHAENMVGRNPNYPIAVNDTSIAQHHATIKIENGQAFLIDKGSVSGVFLNGNRVMSVSRLYHGDVLKFGKCPDEFNFQCTQDADDSLNDRQSFEPRTSLEPKLNLVSDQQYAKMDHLSYLQRGQNYPKTTFEQRQREENAMVDEERARQEKAYQQHISAAAQEKSNIAREKELSIQDIIAEERRILERRHQEEILMLMQDKAKNGGIVEHQHLQTKNKNERLTREVVDREQTILNLQNRVARLEQENESLQEQAALADTKLRALEQFSSELQTKHDSLNIKYREACLQINELSNCELPAKVLEYKRQIESLQKILNQREQERDLYISSNPGDSVHSKAMIERQSAQVVALQQQLDEFKNRNQIVDRKWTQLITECQNARNAQSEVREQMQKQRDTYNRLLALTEQRVIKANLTISAQFEDDQGQAAEFLTSQIQQLYQDNRDLLTQQQAIQDQNTELHQLNLKLKCDLDKYTQWAREAGTDDLINRLEQLQDMLYQVKESTDVTLLVDSSQQIQSLNVELSNRNKIIAELKGQVVKLIGVKGDIRRDEDLVQHMSNVINEKDQLIDQLRTEAVQLHAREKDLRSVIQNYQVPKPQIEPLAVAKPVMSVEEEAVLYLKQMTNVKGNEFGVSVQKVQPKRQDLVEDRNQSEWLYF